MSNYSDAIWRTQNSDPNMAPVLANIRYADSFGYITYRSTLKNRAKTGALEPSSNSRQISSASTRYTVSFTRSLLQNNRQPEQKPEKDPLSNPLPTSEIDPDAHFIQLSYVQEPAPRSTESKINFLLSYPSVYIIYFYNSGNINGCKKDSWVVYVGETNQIAKRTIQHVTQVSSEEPLATARNQNQQPSSSSRETCADAIITRAIQRGIEVRQIVIWQKLFNKSLTLDVENRLIDYMHSIESVTCLNGRTNPQGIYFTSDALGSVISAIWKRLVADNQRILCIQGRASTSRNTSNPTALFPTEEHIWHSSLYKISPFHRLGTGQSKALRAIQDTVYSMLDSWDAGHPSPSLILVEGAAGTGKSILLSTLFYQLMTPETEYVPSVKLLIYNKELLKQYKKMASLQGLLKSKPEDNGAPCDNAGGGTENILNPTKFIHSLTSREKCIPTDIKGTFRRDYYHPTGRVDVVLIDEAHLLFTQGRQGYQGKNQLFDILRRAKVVIAVFDPNQIMNSTQRWETDTLDAFLSRTADFNDEDNCLHEEEPLVCDNSDAYLNQGEPIIPTRYKTYSLRLTQQFRIAASLQVENWIKTVTGANSKKTILTTSRKSDDKRPRIDPIPLDDMTRPDGVYSEQRDLPYEIRVFDSPQQLVEAIDLKRKEFRKRQVDDRQRDKLSAASPHPNDLCRVLATYDWKYTAEKGGSVTLYRSDDGTWAMPASWDSFNRPIQPGIVVKETFNMPWNGTPTIGLGNELANAAHDERVSDTAGNAEDKKDPWAARPSTQHEIGSYFTIQGSDLNYAGVIIGPSVSCNERTGQLIFLPEYSQDAKVSGPRELKQTFVKNQLSVLLTRGVHGLYLFAVDPKLQSYLKNAEIEGHRLYDLQTRNAEVESQCE